MFWNNKRVLVTGHTGFKGTWLSLWLHTLGAKLYGLALPPNTSPSLYSALASTSWFDNEGFIDLANQKAVHSFIADAQPEIIFHLAAQALVRPSYIDPVETFRTNMLGTAHVLDSVRQIPSVRAVVVVTSDKCYDNRELGVPFTEDDPMGGFDPYSSSKGCAELVVSSFRHSFFSSVDAPGVASARAGNVFGGGDWSEDRLIPDIIRAITNKSELVIRYPKSIRPWQHVIEPIRGYLTLGEKLYHSPRDFSEAWNFGPNVSAHKDVEWIVSFFGSRWGDGLSWRISNQDAPYESKLLSLNSTKAANRLACSPRLSVEEGLAWTVDWYKVFYESPEKALELSRQQIKTYESLQ